MTDQLIGHYRVVSTLGTGGMGVVWKAIDTRLNRPVAIKAIREGGAANAEAVLRLRAEALAAASLDHPYICKIYELLETASATLVVMEFVEGETLADIVSRAKPRLVDTLRYGSEVAEGLSNAHQRGIIHRDVKPANVMITPHGHVKLLDFGVARVNDPAAVTQSGLTLPGSVPGTPHYIAPEQALGLPFDSRADLYSLGVLLFRCLTGQLPFEGETRDAYMQQVLSGRVRSLDDLAAEAPAEVREIVKRCLSREPAQRPESASQVAEALRRSAELLSTGTAVMPAHRREGLPSWALQLGLLAVGLVVAAVAAFQSFRQDAAPAPEVRWQLAPVVTWASSESDPRLSPDGKWLSFISDKHGADGLFVQALDTGEPVAVSLPGVVLSHAWAPTATEIVAAVRQDDRLFLMVVPAFFGGAPRLSVALPADTDAPGVRRWSGDAIYVDLNDRGQAGRSLWRVSASTGVFVNVTSQWSSPRRFRSSDVSPDGARVVLAVADGGRSDLWVAGIDGSGLLRLTNDASVERDPVWMGPGAVVFESNRGGQLDLWQIELATGRLVQLTSSLIEEQASGVAGSTIAFQQRSAASNLWRLDLGTGAARAVTADALSDYWPSVSADGTRMVFQRARPLPAEGYQYFDARVLLARLPPAAGNVEAQALDDGFGAVLSPGGDWVAYYQRLTDVSRLKLLVRHTRTGEVRTLSEQAALPAFSMLPPVDWADSNFAWHPSQPELAFVTKDASGHHIQSASLDAGRDVRLLTSSGKDLWNIHFSPDGVSLAYQARADVGTDIRILDVESKRTVTVGTPSNRQVRVRGWLNAHRLLVLSARNAAEGYTVEVSEVAPDGSTRALATVGNGFPFTAKLDPMRRRLFITRVVAGVHNVFAVALEGGRLTQVTTNEASGVSFSGIHPFGKNTILFARDERRRDIWIVKQTSLE